MPRKASEERTKAFDIYVENKGNIKLRVIAEQLNVSEKTVSGWKTKDKWSENLKKVLRKNAEKNKKYSEKTSTIKPEEILKNIEKSTNLTDSTPIKNIKESILKTNSTQKKDNKGGAPFKNKNALGNKGGLGATIKNKYAAKTEEYASIYFEDLDEDEKKLLFLDYDKYTQLFLNIDMLIIRERRIQRRIKELEDKCSGVTVKSVSKSKNDDGKEITTTNIEPVNKQIAELEDVLTRVQTRKQNALLLLHKFEVDSSKISLSLDRLELYRLKTLLNSNSSEQLDEDNKVKTEVEMSKIEQILDENDPVVQGIYNKIYIGYNKLNDS